MTTKVAVCACNTVQLSVIIKTPRETDFLLDIPLSFPLLRPSLPSLHDISPLSFYSNFTRLDMEQLTLPEFDIYKSFENKFTPSLTGTDMISLISAIPAANLDP